MNVGTDIEIPLEVRYADESLADPASLIFFVRPPSGADVQYALDSPKVTRLSRGRFALKLTLELPGRSQIVAVSNYGRAPFALVAHSTIADNAVPLTSEAS